ncbi:MAG TPA: hypothetical protein DD621_04405 [Clostridiales bacterium]|nr:hypothetical protein [Clostridiales bacterium]
MSMLLMKTPYIFAIVAGVCLVGLVILLASILIAQNSIKEKKKEDRNKYLKTKGVFLLKKNLFDNNEKEIYEFLQQTFEPNYHIIPKINLSAFLKPEKLDVDIDLIKNVSFGVFNKNYKIALVIDFSNDEKANRKLHDICESAGIPVLTTSASIFANKETFVGTIKSYLED